MRMTYVYGNRAGDVKGLRSSHEAVSLAARIGLAPRDRPGLVDAVRERAQVVLCACAGNLEGGDGAAR